MRRRPYSLCPWMLLLVAVPANMSRSQLASAASSIPPPDTRTCEYHPDDEHPSARVSNGSLTAIVLLPDTDRGFYRGSRFDWSGLIACASLHGHTFFGQWFDHYDPYANDAVTGPAEEFRHPTSELGYDEAAPGGLFLKIGVGVLKRVDASPYRFGRAYPIVDHGIWTVKTHRRSVTFRQQVRSPIGFAYIYEKVLSVDRHRNILTLEHRLSNTGNKPIDTEVYDHDFYMLDGTVTGPGMEIHLPFVPVPDPALPSSAEIDGTTIRIVGPLQPHHGVGAYITGYTGATSHYDFSIEDTQLGIGIEQTSESPIARMYLWATPRTICPEAYIAVHVAPGQTQSWKIAYRFFTTP